LKQSCFGAPALVVSFGQRGSQPASGSGAVVLVVEVVVVECGMLVVLLELVVIVVTLELVVVVVAQSPERLQAAPTFGPPVQTLPEPLQAPAFRLTEPRLFRLRWQQMTPPRPQVDCLTRSVTNLFRQALESPAAPRAFVASRTYRRRGPVHGTTASTSSCAASKPDVTGHRGAAITDAAVPRHASIHARPVALRIPNPRRLRGVTMSLQAVQ